MRKPWKNKSIALNAVAQKLIKKVFLAANVTGQAFSALRA